MNAARKGGERVQPSRKQSVAALSCDDSTGVGTPVPVGAARRDPRRGESPVMCGQAQFSFLPSPGEVVSGIQAAVYQISEGAAPLCFLHSGAAFYI